MKVISNICYCDIAHPKQVLDIHLPDADTFPVFVYFHGGGMESGRREPQTFTEDLVAKGVCVVNADYRMYPSAAYPEFIRDAAAAVAWVKNHIEEYGHCTKIFIGGSSAGGYLTQMLCFNKSYFAAHNMDADSFGGYFMDAGQPTTHFNILRERGMDPRRVVIDEAAPIYYIDDTRTYAPMRLIISEFDAENRAEQTQLLMGTLKHFGYDMSRVDYVYMPGYKHTEYMETIVDGKSLFADMIYDFIQKWS